MFKRLINLVYIGLIALAIIIPGTSLVDTISSGTTIFSYKIKCNNGQYVILQGSPTDVPWIFFATEKNKLKYDDDQSAKLYCGYYEQARSYVLAYRNTKNREEQVQANLAFNQFELKSNAGSLSTNYSLELSEKSNTKFWNSIENSIGLILIYSFLVQLARVIYQYIVFGVFNLHPFKLTQKSKNK